MPQNPFLLEETEESNCKKISRRKDINGQRAKALLAINSGSTQAEASNITGLTPGQVKYILSRFRKIKLSIFPNELIKVEDTKNKELSTSAKPKTKKKDKKKMGKEKDKKKDKKKKSKETKKKGKKSKKK